MSRKRSKKRPPRKNKQYHKNQNNSKYQNKYVGVKINRNRVVDIAISSIGTRTITWDIYNNDRVHNQV